jgi:hypothetical protein
MSPFKLLKDNDFEKTLNSGELVFSNPNNLAGVISGSIKKI